MKVLFISSGNSKNGISPLVLNQGNSLIKLGHHIEFFTIKGRGFIGYFNAIFSLRVFLKKNKFDLLHAHYGLSGLTAFFANRNLPIIISFMGDDILGSNDLNGKTRKLSILLRRLNRLMASRNYNYSLVKSAEMQKILKVQNSVIIPNGVDLNSFFQIEKNIARKELNLQYQEQIIVFVSNPGRPEKNYKLAQDAVNMIKRTDLRLIAVFNKDHNEINKWLNAADLLVLTSFHEGSPNVVKEAMAVNCPIVSTKVGDVQEVIGEIKGCFLATFDPEVFSEKINLALEYSKKYGRTRGRKRIIDLGIDSHSVAHRIVDVYNKVLEVKTE